jgi:RNA polymerase sigma-70 factor (ECF subfamily)
LTAKATAAEAELVNAKIYVLCRSSVSSIDIGRDAEALGLAQETFVRVYATSHRYAVRGKFSTWLFAIAANLCRNYLRWRQKRGEPVPENWNIEESELTESFQSSDDSPDQAAMRSESISLLRTAINKLPHDLKDGYPTL